MNMADGMDFGLNDPCRDYFTCVGDEYRETSCPFGESIIAGSTTEYQGLILTLVKCETNTELACDYSQESKETVFPVGYEFVDSSKRCANTTDALGVHGPPSCMVGDGLKELEKSETSAENPIAYPSCARKGYE